MMFRVYRIRRLRTKILKVTTECRELRKHLPLIEDDTVKCRLIEKIAVKETESQVLKFKLDRILRT